MMQQFLYDGIINYVSQHPSKIFQKIVDDTTKKYEEEASADTILSICLIHHQRRTKKSYPEKSKPGNVEQYYKTFREKIKASSVHGAEFQPSLLDMSFEREIPPALLARLILNRHLKETVKMQDTEGYNIKTKLNQMMKNPFLIEDQRLQAEVRRCVLHDIGYGCVTDAVRHMVGLEYEEKLKRHVIQLDLPFQDETELRKLGYDKTPDIKLEIPVGINGGKHVICWIESKASFGSPDAHRHYLHDQYYSYWNRFGPGLVIYWFGYVQELAAETLSQGILLADHFPQLDQIIRLQPHI